MKTKIDSRDFTVPAGNKVSLKKWSTLVKPVYKSKKKYTKLLQAQVQELSSMQRLHYASNRYALLLVFQAMDAAGKDGAIRNVSDPMRCGHRITCSAIHTVPSSAWQPTRCRLVHRSGCAVSDSGSRIVHQQSFSPECSTIKRSRAQEWRRKMQG